jgi:hypothetical protein
MAANAISFFVCHVASDQENNPKPAPEWPPTEPSPIPPVTDPQPTVPPVVGLHFEFYSYMLN